MKKVLLTGGCGFVGRHFLTYLLENNYQVICVDNLGSKGSYLPKSHQNLILHICDIRKFFQNNDDTYDLIIHLAAIIGGRSVIDGSPLEIAEDLAIDADFFRWLSKLSNKPGKVVYFSSSASYPITYQQNNDKKTILSEHLINFEKSLGVPDMTYGMSKLVGEYLAKIAHNKYNINIVCYRPFSGYGPDQDSNYPFTAIMGRILKGEKPIKIWSDTVRDFIYIDDIVDCVMSTMNEINDGSAVNIGTGFGISFSELASKMCREVGHETTIEVMNDKPKGVYYRVADTKKLESFNWKPKVSLASGIQRVAEYLKNKS